MWGATAATHGYQLRLQSPCPSRWGTAFVRLPRCRGRTAASAMDMPVSSSTDTPTLEPMLVNSDEFNARVHEAVAGELEAAVGAAVHDAFEAELESVQETVAEAVGQALDAGTVRYDLRANFNTLVALTGVVIFERGVWTAWDVLFGDSAWSEAASIAVGLLIMLAVRVFDIPLAEWRRPGGVAE